MFESVKNALSSSGVLLEDGGIVLVSESLSASANGLVSHFLSWGLSSGHPVCFVALHQTWSHYCNIGNKIGINLRQHAEQENVKVIEGLKLLSEVLDEGLENIKDHPFKFVFEKNRYPLKNLYHLIKQTVEPWRGKYYLMIIDSITSLLTLGLQVQDIDIFIHYCRSLVVNDIYRQNGSLIIVTSNDEKDEDSSHITKMIAHSSVAHLSVSGLSTGLSREIHGDLKLKVFDRKNVQQCLHKSQHFQYKMEEKNMKLFAPGTSTYVL